MYFLRILIIRESLLLADFPHIGNDFFQCFVKGAEFAVPNTRKAALFQLAEHAVHQFAFGLAFRCQVDPLDTAVALLGLAADKAAPLHIVQHTTHGSRLYVAVFRNVPLNTAVVILQIPQHRRLPPGYAPFQQAAGHVPVGMGYMHKGYHNSTVHAFLFHKDR
jgi:hypothetical protein